MPQPRHCTVVARWGRSGWRGVLLCGPSGAGKSDMALRLIDAGWRLVADDYAHVWASNGAVWAATPETIAGRIEARAFDIIPSGYRPSVRVALVVDCVQTPTDRLPEPDFETIDGVRLPRLKLDIRPASAGPILTLAIDRL
ncbi:serine kinase [Brevundimonas sp. NIBR11]|uniref:HPr kinase/phosphorylase n=1 Tax=Brevundimonas sp. NIBR11 TaxID=3015999 RepID=UPI0022F08506|nr:serine kinase [Brevundimonas sp. NIBR11]WGM32521.1 HPr kinase/phosphorylase [Brevundimonas sp. NIBR11]